MPLAVSTKIDHQSGGVTLSYNGKDIILHPLWLRERVVSYVQGETALVDPISQQRLYEHAEFPISLHIRAFTQHSGSLDLEFSDGGVYRFPLRPALQELGWMETDETLPAPKTWDGSLDRLPQARWADIDDPSVMKGLLTDYFSHGFCILQDTPTKRDALKMLARRFGYLRETNFGELFNVETKTSPTDLAYTDAALASHSDNPYRDPVPGIQYLHCLANSVSGGLSTLVDGMKIAERLREESPEQADILERVNVQFRYTGPSAILEHFGPLIERDHAGIIRQVRLSSRVDYVPALDVETLSHFYAGRRRMHEMSNSPEFQINFPFKPGTLLMMDNYRLLHGRTAFDGKEGYRHLQGGYIDHDGPASLYRMLMRDGKTTSVQREV